MKHVCPWCCERLKTGLHAGVGTCSHCGRPLVGDDGRELRMLDLRFDRVRADQERRFLQLTGIGIAVVVITAIGMGFVGPVGLIGAPLLLVGHLLAVRFYLLLGPMLLLSRARRAFVRWITRLVFMWVGGLGYGFASTPVVGPIAAACVFGGLTWLAHAYTSWSLKRELDRLPLARWERLTLALLVGVTLVVVVVVFVLALLLGWGINALAQ